MADSAEIANDELFKKMQGIIADKLEIDASKVTPDATFRGDLGADSLDTYELVYAIEEDTGVKIPDDVANEFESVKDAYNYIKTHQ
ncbi:MAG: acyl carrier protein [Treponema sp.]|nr:acyl carrier protein [Treponema sp.]